MNLRSLVLNGELRLFGLRLLAPAFAAAVFALATFPLSASAGNYYGAAYHYVATHGTQMDITSDRLQWGCLCGSEFIINNSWVASQDLNYWVEAGIGSAGVPDCPGSPFVEPTFFWADNRPNGGGFHCHDNGDTASLGTEYFDKIKYQGGGEWTGSVGPLSVDSTSNITSAGFIEAGTETTTQTDTVGCSRQRHLVWWGAQDVEHSGWDNASLTESQPPHAIWVNQPFYVRDWTNYPSCSL